MSKRTWIAMAEGFSLYMAVDLGFPAATNARVLVVTLVIIVVVTVAELLKDLTDGN